MTHPLEHLAPYVDGSLGPAERAEVDEHLLGCARCRAEVGAAAQARDAVRAIPEPAGIDLTDRFAPERVRAMRPPRRSAGGRPSPWSKVVPALAAAAIVALIALAVPRLGGSGGDEASGGIAADAGATATDGPLRLRLDPTAYDAASLESALAGYASTLGTSDDGGDGAQEDAAAGELASPEGAVGLRAAGRSRTRRAVACLEQAFPGYPGRIVEVRRTTYDGEPAYVAFVLEGPGAGEPPTALTAWVASAEDCSILTLTSFNDL